MYDALKYFGWYDYLYFNGLRKGSLKKETESTIIAAQDPAIATNNIRKVIFKEDVSPLC